MQHFLGDAAHPGGYDPQIRTRPRFLYNAPTRQVSSSYVYLFESYRLDKRTNPRTNDAAQIIQRSSLYATTLGEH